MEGKKDKVGKQERKQAQGIPYQDVSLPHAGLTLELIKKPMLRKGFPTATYPEN